MANDRTELETCIEDGDLIAVGYTKDKTKGSETTPGTSVNILGTMHPARSVMSACTGKGGCCNCKGKACKPGTMDLSPLDPTPSLLERIEQIDLTMPLLKACDPEEGYGWTPEHARVVERDYRRFLFLTVTQTKPIVPTKDVDALWHSHILDTEKYASDCAEVFGAFLHHFPYFGLRGGDDRAKLVSAFEETKRIWAATFGSSEFAA